MNASNYSGSLKMFKSASEYYSINSNILSASMDELKYFTLSMEHYANRYEEITLAKNVLSRYGTSPDLELYLKEIFNLTTLNLGMEATSIIEKIKELWQKFVHVIKGTVDKILNFIQNKQRTLKKYKSKMDNFDKQIPGSVLEASKKGYIEPVMPIGEFAPAISGLKVNSDVLKFDHKNDQFFNGRNERSIDWMINRVREVTKTKKSEKDSTYLNPKKLSFLLEQTIKLFDAIYDKRSDFEKLQSNYASLPKGSGDDELYKKCVEVIKEDRKKLAFFIEEATKVYTCVIRVCNMYFDLVKLNEKTKVGDGPAQSAKETFSQYNEFSSLEIES